MMRITKIMLNGVIFNFNNQMVAFKDPKFPVSQPTEIGLRNMSVLGL